jgi:hypothetical protein
MPVIWGEQSGGAVFKYSYQVGKPRILWLGHLGVVVAKKENTFVII